jgi:hypothetical protein
MKMQNKKIVLGAIAMVVALIAGCASIVGGGSTQQINISSNPEGAVIWQGKLKNKQVVDLVDTGLRTPTNITLPRRGAVVVLKKEGYQDTNLVLTQKVNGWFFGNIIIGGLIGSSIDISTGASMKFDPDNLFVEMQPAASTAAAE